jgi:hypothetical protein
MDSSSGSPHRLQSPSRWVREASLRCPFISPFLSVAHFLFTQTVDFNLRQSRFSENVSSSNDLEYRCGAAQFLMKR